MSTLHEEPSGRVLYVKGALEVVLPLCVSCERAQGVEALSEERRGALQAAEAAMASEGLRVLAFAYRHVAREMNREHLEEDLTFAGLVGLHDPPRREVPTAIAECRRAGIKVIMVTGDHAQTALAIARIIGLAGAEPAIVTGQDLERLSDAQLRFVLERPELVFARVSANRSCASCAPSSRPAPSSRSRATG